MKRVYEPYYTIDAVLERNNLVSTLDELVMTMLMPREREVIKYRYGLVDGEPKTFKEIGEKIGVHRVRAWQIFEKAIRRLRHPKISDKILEVIDIPKAQEKRERRRKEQEEEYKRRKEAMLQTAPGVYAGIHIEDFPALDPDRPTINKWLKLDPDRPTIKRWNRSEAECRSHG